VLTLSEYRREYGGAGPGEIRRELPLPRVLSLAVGANPLMFIGCSLENDRTTLIVAYAAAVWRSRGPLTPVGGGYRSSNVRLREEFHLYANVRPARTLIPGGRYEDIDIVLVRENLEDLYCNQKNKSPFWNAWLKKSPRTPVGNKSYWAPSLPRAWSQSDSFVEVTSSRRLAIDPGPHAKDAISEG
jgi:Isocitrate/isopropylmalate dehydrogenase